MKDLSFETITVGTLATNCYIIINRLTRDSIIIDPGSEAEKITQLIDVINCNVKAIFITHGHVDHIGALKALKEKYGAPVYVHADDAQFLENTTINGADYIGVKLDAVNPDHLMTDGQIIEAGSLKLKIIHTPGHTPGGICIAIENLLFTGDTLFCGSVGRWDFPLGSELTLRSSLKKFLTMPENTVILPGHGNKCTIGGELDHNPYLINI